MKTQSKAYYIDQVEAYLPESYRKDLKESANCMSSGIAAVSIYLKGGGRRHILDAYRTGSLVGLNTRIFDDFIDGDGVEPIEDQEGFIQNYLDSLSGESPEPLEQHTEQAVYTAGNFLGKVSDPTLMTDYWKDFTEIVVSEDKSSPEGYREHAKNAGGILGEMVGASIAHLEDFNPDTYPYKFGYDLGYIGMVSDDLLDEEIDIIEAKKEEIIQDSVRRISRHGVSGKSIGLASRKYPAFYQIMKIAVKASN